MTKHTNLDHLSADVRGEGEGQEDQLKIMKIIKPKSIAP